MLRGRRLLLPQSPLSGWRTTASTAAARRASHSTTRRHDGLRPGSSALAEEVPIKVVEESLVKGENEADLQRPNANSETTTKGDLGGPHGFSAFRKYALDLKFSNRDRELASYEKHPFGNRQGKNGRSFKELTMSGTTQADLPQSPVVETDATSQWTEDWMNRIGKRIGVRVSNFDAVQFKLSIARRLGLNVQDPRILSPRAALAEIKDRERLAKSARRAKARQKELARTGTVPPFIRRNFESKGDPNFKSNQARLRWSEMEAESKFSGLSPPKKNSKVSQRLKVTQPTCGDLFGADLRDTLRDAEVTSALSNAGKSMHFSASKDRTESLFQPHAFPAVEPEPAPLWLKGERVSTDIRFTVRPTWLPFDRSTIQAAQKTTREDKFEGSPQAATEAFLVTKAGNEDRKPSRSATDSTKEPNTRLAGGVPALNPDSKLARPERSSQESLTETPQPRETFHDIFGMLFPQEAGADFQPLRDEGDVKRKARSVSKRRSRPETTRGGIYKKLFPDDLPEDVEPQLRSKPQQEETDKQSPLPNEDLVPSEESIFVSLRNEVRNWIPKEQLKNITAPEPGEHGSHSTVLILSGLSNTLIDTDFYRILPEAKHIEGWAGGLVKIVQARHAISHEPIGRYFLMFHSQPAADAYKAEILRLHSLSKRLLHSSTGEGSSAIAPANPQPFLTDEEKAAARSFTLCPPTVPLLINVHMWNTNLIRAIAKNIDIADVVQALRPDVATPSKVLVTVNTMSGSKGGVGGGLTTDELWLTLRDDGRERGAPWVLSNLKDGIMPVKLSFNRRQNKMDFRSEAVQASLEGPIYDELDMLAEPPTTTKTEPSPARRVTYDALHDENAKKNDIFGQSFSLAPESTPGPAIKVGREEKFNRFVVTFTQPSVARRFVRMWHKRSIWDAYEQRSVSIDAVALM